VIQAVWRPGLDTWGPVLPAEWWTIALADEARRARSIEQLVERQFGHADASAVLKRAMLAEVTATAESGGRGRAADGGVPPAGRRCASQRDRDR